MLRNFLFVLGLFWIPVFYIGFILCGMHISINELYRSFFEHYRSGESFGMFDRYD